MIFVIFSSLRSINLDQPTGADFGYQMKYYLATIIRAQCFKVEPFSVNTEIFNIY